MEINYIFVNFMLKTTSVSRRNDYNARKGITIKQIVIEAQSVTNLHNFNTNT